MWTRVGGLSACGRLQLSITVRLAVQLHSDSYHPYSDGSGCTKWTTQVARCLLSVAPWSEAWNHASVVTSHRTACLLLNQ